MKNYIFFPVVLQKAGTHMEFTFLASYIVMLVGFLIMDNPDRQNFVRQFLKGNNFADMVELLKKFFNFMNLTASVSTFSPKTIQKPKRIPKFFIYFFLIFIKSFDKLIWLLSFSQRNYLFLIFILFWEIFRETLFFADG